MVVLPDLLRIAARACRTPHPRRETPSPPRTSCTALLAVALAGPGCASVLSFEGVRPMKANALAVQLEPSAIGSRAPQGDNEQRYAATSVRYGITDDVAVGVRVGYNTRPELLARFQLLHPDRGLLSLAFVPTLGALYTPDSFGDSVRIYSQPTLVLGLGDSWRVSPVVTAKFDVTGGVSLATGGESSSMTRGGKTAVVVTPIITVGAVVRVSDRFALQPELGIGRGAAYVGTGGPQLTDGVVMQAGIAMMIGGEQGFSL